GSSGLCRGRDRSAGGRLAGLYPALPLPARGRPRGHPVDRVPGGSGGDPCPRRSRSFRDPVSRRFRRSPLGRAGVAGAATSRAASLAELAFQPPVAWLHGRGQPGFSSQSDWEKTMKYACLVYHDASKLTGLSEAEQLAAILAECEAAGAWRAELEKGGHH